MTENPRTPTSPDLSNEIAVDGLSAPIKEEPVSSHEGNFTVPNIYTPIDQSQYPSPRIKEEKDSKEDGALTVSNIYTPTDPTQQHPPSHISYLVPDNTVFPVCTKKSEDNSNSKMNEIEVIYQHPVQSTFGDISNLTKYQRVHSRKKTPQCPECGEYFLRKAHLVTHQRLHMGKNPLQCPECGKTFSSTSQLISRQKYHREKKLFRCSECGQLWPDKA
ncbi:uncharacterized protein LOC142663463 [Rhinoderma darwinii]|uniref:uncharacterized protein LOC142663463 n=1 Tax=Rhinoderma darwinii TaxID=43563 RepID=UPI003F67E985